MKKILGYTWKLRSESMESSLDWIDSFGDLCASKQQAKESFLEYETQLKGHRKFKSCQIIKVVAEVIE